MINVFKGLLERWHGYVKVFQSTNPLVHMLHRKMVYITREILAISIKPVFMSDSGRLDVADKTL